MAQQSARIGIAESDLYPRIAVTGMLGYESENLSDLWFQGNSFIGTIGPGFRWNILNYGRIINNVSAEHARLRQLVFSYQDTVPYAQFPRRKRIVFHRFRFRVGRVGSFLN